jgi:hypothetical protein
MNEETVLDPPRNRRETGLGHYPSSAEGLIMQIILDFIYHEYFRASLSGAKVASAI